MEDIEIDFESHIEDRDRVNNEYAPPRRSSWVQIMTEERMRSLEQEELAFLVYYDALHKDNYHIQNKIDDLIAFKTIHFLDTIYYH